MSVDPRRVVGSQLATGCLVGLSRRRRRLRDPIDQAFHAIGLADVSGRQPSASPPKPPRATSVLPLASRQNASIAGVILMVVGVIGL